MKFLYFSNNKEIIKILNPIQDIDTVFVDLEIIGKRKRQANTSSLISNHSYEDISKLKKIVKGTNLGVRINPINTNSKFEINESIKRGAEVIMLPMFKTVDEVLKCIEIIEGRCQIDLLFETPEALENISNFPLNDIRFSHFGINDISLALKYRNMFECFLTGILDEPTKYLTSKGKLFGIGGVGSYNAKPISPKIIMEMHKYYSSSRVILSRNFLNNLDLNSTDESKKINELQIKGLIDLVSLTMNREINNFGKSKLILKETLNNLNKSN